MTVPAPMAGVVVAVKVTAGEAVAATTEVVVLESMKMHHAVAAETAGIVEEVFVRVGDTVVAGARLVAIEARDDGGVTDEVPSEIDLGARRADLDALIDRRALLHDATRPDAVARRRKVGHRTARENLADLCDPGSFEEWGGLAHAAQTSRRDLDELVRATPADGLITGIARVNGDLVRHDRAHCAVLSYDYTVLAGTQGYRNHQKKDRLFELAERLRLPVVLFAEGGGGRPGDTDVPVIAGLDTRAFALYARLSGLVPLVGIAAGRCFAGNAALLGCSDVVIATADATIGMGGPAMIEGGGLGVFRPEEVGPVSVQAPNGVIDIVVDGDPEAVDAAKRYLGYFQGAITSWDAPDQRPLRHVVPEARQQVYDVRTAIDTVADTGSVLELRRAFGAGMVTSLARIAGRPVGIVANVPTHLGGAIDTPAADKAARFLQLCDGFDVPVVFLCDTPGFMVGPDAERTAQVRHFSRLFVTGANMSVPVVTVVLRKGYGLGAQAMAGGSFREPDLVVAWPTGEFGGMGLEGAVRLAYRRELEAIVDAEERGAAFDRMVAAAYERGRALNMAAHLEIDDVIDPADTRDRILGVLRARPDPGPRSAKKRPAIDTW